MPANSHFRQAAKGKMRCQKPTNFQHAREHLTQMRHQEVDPAGSQQWNGDADASADADGVAGCR